MSAAESSLNSLPEELIFEVFVRLPEKSLLRSRCVSKGFRDLFDSPIFKKRYELFHYSVSDFSVLTIESEVMYSMDFHIPDNLNSSVEKYVAFPQGKNHQFVGCCKGIVCLSVLSNPRYFILMNPFNGTFQNVSRHNLYPVTFYNPFTAFGYDYAKDDYKIVMIEPVKTDNINLLSVYSRKSDSWRKVLGEFSPGFPSESAAIYVDGALHWLWWFNEKGYTCIFAFDLETESLRSLPLPTLTNNARVYSPLKGFGGRLCVFVKPRDSCRVLWVMEEYGIETSWTPVCSIPDNSDPIGYFPICDRVLLLSYGIESDFWTWLNTQDGSTQNLQLHKLPHEEGDDNLWYEAKSWVCVKSPFRL